MKKLLLPTAIISLFLIQPISSLCKEKSYLQITAGGIVLPKLAPMVGLSYYITPNFSTGGRLTVSKKGATLSGQIYLDLGFEFFPYNYIMGGLFTSKWFNEDKTSPGFCIGLGGKVAITKRIFLRGEIEVWVTSISRTVTLFFGYSF